MTTQTIKTINFNQIETSFLDNWVHLAYENWAIANINGEKSLLFDYGNGTPYNCSIILPEKWESVPQWAKLEYLLSMKNVPSGETITLIYSKGTHKECFYVAELDEFDIFYDGSESSYLYAYWKEYGKTFECRNGRWKETSEILSQFKKVEFQPNPSTVKMFGASNSKAYPLHLKKALASSYGGKWSKNAYKLWQEGSREKVEMIFPWRTKPTVLCCLKF